ncbi:hypothetical protein BC941DRAFT_13103 [Chlamydoabsidia padenii]|nr:hypothetical protein BC941DRAFT_13103 [Chlamydoabsidia padenii]
MYVSIGFATPCVVRPITGCERPWHYYFTGMTAGAMVLFEARGRQLGKYAETRSNGIPLTNFFFSFFVIELGLYCLTRAMESWWGTMVKRGHVKNLPQGDTLLFMLSMGTLMTIYQTDRKTIASHYLSVMTRFFGNN